MTKRAERVIFATMRRSAEKQAYLDELASFFGAHGLPPMAGRLMAHLLLCEPPGQSFEALCTAVGASRATVSTMTRLLARLGLLERRAGRGRTFTYLLPDGAWTRLLEDDLRNATVLREFAQKGLKLSGAGSRSRLRNMEEFFTFLERQLDGALNAWRRKP